MCLDKYTVTYIHYYFVLQHRFTALKTVCVLPVYPSPVPAIVLSPWFNKGSLLEKKHMDQKEVALLIGNDLCL